MVIEHSFVTTHEPADALTRVTQYLAARGFELDPNAKGAFAVGEPGAIQTWTTLQMRRGKKKAARARNVIQLPQKVCIEWTRGRVDLALSIGINGAWGGSSRSSKRGISSAIQKRLKLHYRLVTEIVMGIENLLAYNASGTSDYQQWDNVERDCLSAARRRRVRKSLIFGLLVVVTILIILAASMKR